MVMLTAILHLSEAQAQVPDHPVIKPLPDVISKTGRFHKYDAFKFRVREGDMYEDKEVRGKHWFFEYHLKEGSSGLETLVNYKDAALEKSGVILYEDNEKLVFNLPTDDGGTLWVQVYRDNWQTAYQVNIVEEKEFKRKLTFGAAEMKRELEHKGAVIIYGINFDFDMATLKPGSEKPLMEMVKLMKSTPSLRIEIQGHTDNIGGSDYNLTLSRERADTVKEFLQLYGIEEARMTTVGHGFNKPVDSNDTEEGRAKNRRVELKKIGG